MQICTPAPVVKGRANLLALDDPLGSYFYQDRELSFYWKARVHL